MYTSGKKITSDSEILGIVHGYKLELTSTLVQTRVPSETKFTENETKIVQNELAKLLQKEVIVECDHEQGEFISPIFLREKKDGSSQVILNLKQLNKYIVDHHFKMETLDTAVNMLVPGA